VRARGEKFVLHHRYKGKRKLRAFPNQTAVALREDTVWSIKSRSGVNALGRAFYAALLVPFDRLYTSRISDRAHSRGRSQSPKNRSPIDGHARQGPRVSWRLWRKALDLSTLRAAVQFPFADTRVLRPGGRCFHAIRPIHRSLTQRSGYRLLRPGERRPALGSNESILRSSR
jgi:hypothetical protein